MACEIKATIEQQEIKATLSDQTIQAKVNAIKVPYYGQMSSQTTQTVNITTAGVHVPMNITGTFDIVNSQGTTAPTVGTFGVKNTSGRALRFLVIATADVEIGNNKRAGWRLAVNGVALPETTCSATTGTVNFAKLMTQWIVQLNDGDEVTCLLANLTDSNDIQVDRSKIVAVMV
jgi:hypothetical protein